MNVVLLLTRNGRTFRADLTPFLFGTRAENEWDESKHPRQKDGKFGKGGAMRPKTETPKPKVPRNAQAPLYVKGNEIFSPSDDIKVKREKAIAFYKRNLANKSVQCPALSGNVIFASSRYKKPISSSADIRKLQVFYVLDGLVRKGKIISSEPDRQRRVNVSRVYTLGSYVIINGKKECVRITVRKESNGLLYYDHVISF